MKTFTKIFFSFTLLTLLQLNLLKADSNNTKDSVASSISTQLIEQNNPYNTDWFNNLYYSWQLKNFSDNNKIPLEDVAIINLSLGSVELYLTKLPDLIVNINNTFNNNPNFTKFNTGSIANNLFNFLAYLKTLDKNDRKSKDDLLKKAFNMYEIVSINRLLEIDLATKVTNARKLMSYHNLTNETMERMANEYNVLYVQELSYAKEDRSKNDYSMCISKVKPNKDLIANIENCNKKYGNATNQIIGIRSCYLNNIKIQIENQNNSNPDINKITKEINNNCATLVNNYLENNMENTEFLKKHLAFLMNFYITQENVT